MREGPHREGQERLRWGKQGNLTPVGRPAVERDITEGLGRADSPVMRHSDKTAI